MKVENTVLSLLIPEPKDIGGYAGGSILNQVSGVNGKKEELLLPEQPA